MAAFPVGLAPWLRPWVHNGLDYMLASEALPAPWSLTLPAVQAAQQAQQHRRQGLAAERPNQSRGQGAGGTAQAAQQKYSSYAQPAKSQHQPNAPTTAGRAPQHQAPNLPQQGKGQSWAQNRSQYKTQGAAEQEYDDRQSAAAGKDAEAPLRQPRAAAAPAVDSSAWPLAWQEFFSQAKQGRVLWTYQYLGDDLGGAADPQRRALLNRLLKDMNLPAGTSTFWPCCLPQHCGGTAAPEIFWQGVRALKARMVIVMGYKAMRAVALPEEATLWSQVRHEGCLVYVTPDVPLLLAEPQRYAPTMQFLRENIGRAVR
ncbi:MAG: hypothetical protein PHN64_00855 [Desulfovibrionaceae bacterium]|nr:hypothetical protein [Desulfovibrionaceae bacterium]